MINYILQYFIIPHGKRLKCQFQEGNSESKYMSYLQWNPHLILLHLKRFPSLNPLSSYLICHFVFPDIYIIIAPKEL
jgi:hypothetical protein